MALDACLFGSNQVLAIVADFYFLLTKRKHNLDCIQSLLSISCALSVSLHAFLEALGEGNSHEVGHCKHQREVA